MYDLNLLFFVHCFTNKYNQQETTIGWLSNVSKTSYTMNKYYVDGVVSSVELMTVSGSETPSVVASGIVGFELLVDSSVVSDFVAVGGGGVDITGDTITGEFRCCSSSYSLIKRFLSGCALFDEIDVVGDVDDETGDVAIGGVLVLVFVCIGLIGGLLRFDDWSTLIDNDDSCCGSDGDGRV